MFFVDFFLYFIKISIYRGNIMSSNLADFDQMFSEIAKDDILLSLKNIDDVISLYDSFFLNLVDDRTEYLKMLKENYRRIFISKCFGFLERLLGQEEDVQFYQGDIGLLEKAVDLTIKFQDCQQQLRSTLNEENYQEIAKAMLFTDYYYQFNINYIDEQRETLQMRQVGINASFMNDMKCNNADDAIDFVLSRLLSKNLDKSVEKVKKM